MPSTSSATPSQPTSSRPTPPAMKRWPCRSWKKRTQPVIAGCVSRICSDTGSISTCRLPANGLCVGTAPCAGVGCWDRPWRSAARLSTARLRALAGHAGSRQPDRRGVAHLHRPAYGDRDTRRIVGRRARRLDQLGRRAPLARRPGRRLALAQQVLDIVGIDQHGAGHAHHHQGQQQDQADPEMELLQPVAQRSTLRLGSRGHRYLVPSAGSQGWRQLARSKRVSLRRVRGRSGRWRAPRHRPAPACRRR